MSAGAPLIACAGLIKRFGERQVLGPVDLALHPGDRLALLGPNGAGQDDAALAAGGLGTSPARAACSGPTCARSAWCRSAPRSTAASARARTWSSSRASRGCRSRRPSSPSWRPRWRSATTLDRPVERLSLGQAQRVNVAIGLLGRPRVVLLDEPTAALDPGHRLALWSMLERVSERGGAVAFATQNVEEARLAADRVLVLVEGRAAYAGPQEAFWQEAGAVDAPAGTSAPSSPSSSAHGAPREPLRLLLRKDLLLLARSRPLLAVLIVYPLVLSLLVGGVLGGQGARPRVAFVNEDDIPNIVHIGDRSFDFGRIVRQAGKRVQLVNLTLPRARRALDDGDVVAVIIVPRGFIAELSSLIASPQVELLTNRNAYEERILRETQAFVYTLNSEVQTEYIRSNSHFLDVLVSGGKAHALGQTYNVLGLDCHAHAHRGRRGRAARG